MYKPDNENVKRRNFNSKNTWNIPEIRGLTEIEPIEFIGFNYAKTFARNGQTKFGIHFFLDDYQFKRLWNNPDKYLDLLKQFEIVLSPDFSLYLDYPRAMQIWKHYQKHWLAAYWEEHGIKVIPTIGWSDHESFAWCFDGEPKEAIVAVSSIGTQRYEKSKRLFLDGYSEMMKRLRPKLVLFWGNVPDEIDKSKILHMGYTMDEKFKILRK